MWQCWQKSSYHNVVIITSMSDHHIKLPKLLSLWLWIGRGSYFITTIISTMSNHHHLTQMGPKRFRLPLQKALLQPLLGLSPLRSLCCYGADGHFILPRLFISWCWCCDSQELHTSSSERTISPQSVIFVMGYHQPSKISLSSSPHWQMRQVYLLEHSALHLMSQPTQLVTALQWPNT